MLLCNQVVSESFVTPMDCNPPGSMRFSRQESWNGLPLSPPGDLSKPGIKPVSLELAGGFFTTEAPDKPRGTLRCTKKGLRARQSKMIG